MWLHNLMQNPLYNQTPELEDSLDKEMRMKFWQATEIDFN